MTAKRKPRAKRKAPSQDDRNRAARAIMDKIAAAGVTYDKPTPTLAAGMREIAAELEAQRPPESVVDRGMRAFFRRLAARFR